MLALPSGLPGVPSLRASPLSPPLPAPVPSETSPREGADEEPDEDDEADVEDLLYAAQCDLIAHKTEWATQKYERAVEMGSSAACATLANLLSRGWRTDTITHSTPATDPISLDSPAPPRPLRPAAPSRQHSNLFAHANQSYRKTPESLRATALFIRGLEIEVDKPVKEQEGGTPPLESGYGSGSDDDYGAEGRFFSLDRTLDLVVGMTDSHRFGILHAPTASKIDVNTQMPSPKSDEEELEVNDALWFRSCRAAKTVLAHPSIAPVLATASPATDARALSTSPSRAKPLHKRRASSVSRSYTHASTWLDAPPPSSPRRSNTLPASHPPHLTATLKLQLTIAVHALYILGLQAYSSSTAPSSSSSPSCLSCDAQTYWTTITRLASPFAAQGGIGIKEGDELVARAAHRLEALNHQDLGPNEPWRLAKLIKKPAVTEGMEFSVPCEVEEDEEEAEQEEQEAERPDPTEQRRPTAIDMPPSMPLGSLNTVVGSFGGRTPRASAGAAKFHLQDDLVEEGDLVEPTPAQQPWRDASAADTAEAADAGGSGFSLNPPADLLVSRPRSVPSSAAARLAARQQYPSPPETPPLEPGPKLFDPSSSSSMLSPPPSGRGATLHLPHSSLAPPAPSSSSSAPLPTLSASLPRATSTTSFASFRSSASRVSVLSNFSVNPLHTYLAARGLRRTESHASISTAPPDFEAEGARRWTRTDKGKGRATDADLDADAALSSSTSALSVLESAGRTSKTWLSRFRSAAHGVASDPGRRLSAAFGLSDARGRTRSSSAVHELRRALERHDDAVDAVLNYWGEDEFVEDDEVGPAYLYVGADGESVDEEGDAVEIRIPAAGSEFVSPPPHFHAHGHAARSASEQTVKAVPTAPAHAERALALAASLSLSQGEGGALRPPMPRQASRRSQRSFALGDPTSTSTSGETSPPRSKERHRHRTRSRNHSREASAASSVSCTSSSTGLASPGLLAPPSPTSRAPKPPKPVSIDPLLLELERRSRVGVRTVCAACGKKGLNFPACRACGGTYCGRECRRSGTHEGGCEAARGRRRRKEGEGEGEGVAVAA
ncbi:hypothetical protein JCM10207_006174 [Rhodosporidiobolus poonsookiae]